MVTKKYCLTCFIDGSLDDFSLEKKKEFISDQIDELTASQNQAKTNVDYCCPKTNFTDVYANDVL